VTSSMVTIRSNLALDTHSWVDPSCWTIRPGIAAHSRALRCGPRRKRNRTEFVFQDRTDHVLATSLPGLLDMRDLLCKL
jgi:hypothetical protein